MGLFPNCCSPDQTTYVPYNNSIISLMSMLVTVQFTYSQLECTLKKSEACLA